MYVGILTKPDYNAKNFNSLDGNNRMIPLCVVRVLRLCEFSYLLHDPSIFIMISALTGNVQTNDTRQTNKQAHCLGGEIR